MTQPELLRAVNDGTLKITGQSLWQVLRHKDLIQVVGHDQNVIHGMTDLKKVANFRLTRRGFEALEASQKGSVSLSIDKADPPLKIRLWLSGFRRMCRNCPKELRLAFSDDKLHVLAADTGGVIKDDELHRLDSLRVPWVE